VRPPRDRSLIASRGPTRSSRPARPPRRPASATGPLSPAFTGRGCALATRLAHQPRGV